MNEKEAYYKSEAVVNSYEHRRFGRGGGAYVAAKEQEIIHAMVLRTGLRGGIALDCPAGTGRFLPLLQQLGFKVTAVDTSPSMLACCKRHPASSYLQASADRLPLEENFASLWLMSRFCFHFADPRPFLQEAARVLNPGGFLLFDTYNWTPRQWIPGSQRWLGGRTSVHSEKIVGEWANDLGFELVMTTPVFLVAPYLYSFIPLWMARGFEGLGSWGWPFRRSKSYYLFRKKMLIEPAAS